MMPMSNVIPLRGPLRGARVRARPDVVDWIRAVRRRLRRFSCAARLYADRYASDPPAGVEERWITTADGVRLHAWYAPTPDAVATLVWSHGNGLSVARRPGLLGTFAALGLNVLAYDYRGCGRSGGRPSEKGLYLDALAAYDSERARDVPAHRIIAFGESLGGAVAIHLATRRPCAGVAVVSTFTRLRDLHKGLGLLARFAPFDSLARVPQLTVPILIAHGDRDETIRFELGRRLFAAANDPKWFCRVAGARHHDVLASPELVDAIGVFARGVAASERRANGTH
jgi:hypothetical protein